MVTWVPYLHQKNIINICRTTCTTPKVGHADVEMFWAAIHTYSVCVWRCSGQRSTHTVCVYGDVLGSGPHIQCVYGDVLGSGPHIQCVYGDVELGCCGFVLGAGHHQLLSPANQSSSVCRSS